MVVVAQELRVDILMAVYSLYDPQCDLTTRLFQMFTSSADHPPITCCPKISLLQSSLYENPKKAKADEETQR